jgi:hypothetical protein
VTTRPATTGGGTTAGAATAVTTARLALTGAPSLALTALGALVLVMGFMLMVVAARRPTEA